MATKLSRVRQESYCRQIDRRMLTGVFAGVRSKRREHTRFSDRRDELGIDEHSYFALAPFLLSTLDHYFHYREFKTKNTVEKVFNVFLKHVINHFVFNLFFNAA